MECLHCNWSEMDNVLPHFVREGDLFNKMENMVKNVNDGDGVEVLAIIDRKT